MFNQINPQLVWSQLTRLSQSIRILMIMIILVMIMSRSICCLWLRRLIGPRWPRRSQLNHRLSLNNNLRDLIILWFLIRITRIIIMIIIILVLLIIIRLLLSKFYLTILDLSFFYQLGLCQSILKIMMLLNTKDGRDRLVTTTRE